MSAKFSYTETEQRLLFEHYLAYRLRLSEIDTLFEIWSNCTKKRDEPSPFVENDVNWQTANSLMLNLMYAQVVSLFDKDKHSLDFRGLLVKLYPERAQEIVSFVDKHAATVDGLRRFRNKAVAHMDRRLFILLATHYEKGSMHFLFFRDFLTITDSLVKQEKKMLARFSIDLVQHLKTISEQVGSLPGWVARVFESLGLRKS